VKRIAPPAGYIMDALKKAYLLSLDEGEAVTFVFNGAEYVADAPNGRITTSSEQPPNENGEGPAFWVRLANGRIATYADPVIEQLQQRKEQARIGYQRTLRAIDDEIEQREKALQRKISELE